MEAPVALGFWPRWCIVSLPPLLFHLPFLCDFFQRSLCIPPMKQGKAALGLSRLMTADASSPDPHWRTETRETQFCQATLQGKIYFHSIRLLKTLCNEQIQVIKVYQEQQLLSQERSRATLNYRETGGRLPGLDWLLFGRSFMAGAKEIGFEQDQWNKISKISTWNMISELRSYPTNKQVLPNSHLPKHNLLDCGTLKSNSTKPR